MSKDTSDCQKILLMSNDNSNVNNDTSRVMLKDASNVKRSLLCKRMSLKWKEYHLCLKMLATSNVNSSARISGHGHDV
jgi:hypothetical protein